ncbi:MAG: aminopeptidase P family protein [Clostridia bacterium]|nr:aminopeptidase P family protein [Clostridia bacterium]
MIKKDKLFDILPDVDAVVITSQNNRLYFTEFNGTFGVLVLTRDDASYITDFRYFEMAREAMQNSGIDVLLCENGAKAYEIASDLLHNINAKKVGYEDTETTVSAAKILFDRLPDFEFTPAGKAILTVRQVKDDRELDLIAKAQQITDKAFSKILTIIKGDMTEYDVSVELEYQLRKNGAEGLAFETIIASGSNSSKPHAHPTSKKIKNGDAITMDFGARYKGYCADMTRTVFYGKPNDEMKNIYNTVLKAQLNTITNMRCGMIGKEVDALARQVIVSAGYTKHFNHGLGHSVGIDIHESPSCNPVSEEVLMENMLMTVEPGIYVPDFGGVRIEDLVIVKQDKIIDLTTSSKEIIVL